MTGEYSECILFGAHQMMISSGACRRVCVQQTPESKPAACAVLSVLTHIQVSHSTQYGSREKSELSKWRLNELCCRCTVHLWNRLELSFPSRYAAKFADKNCQGQVSDYKERTVHIVRIIDVVHMRDELSPAAATESRVASYAKPAAPAGLA